MMTNLHARSTPTQDQRHNGRASVPASRSPVTLPAAPPLHPKARALCLVTLLATLSFAIGVSLLGTSLRPARPSVEENSAIRVSHSAFPPRPSVEKNSAFLAELPAPSPSAFGSWLISAVAALSILALGKQFMRKTPIEAEFLTKKEFHEFRDKVETNFSSLRDRLDHSHETLANKLDGINNRLHDVRSLVDRLDERIHHVSRIPHQEGGNPS